MKDNTQNWILVSIEALAFFKKLGTIQASESDISCQIDINKHENKANKLLCLFIYTFRYIHILFII